MYHNYHYEFKTTKSNSSCRVSDILGITFGACSSRFWLFRKHIISLPRKCAHKVPFYSW